MSNVPQQLFVSGPMMKARGGKSPNRAVWLKALLSLCGKSLLSAIAARRCHSKYHQVLCRHEAEESGVMESPQTRISPCQAAGEAVSAELRPEQSGMRYPRSATTQRPGSILHRPPLLGTAAERAVPLQSCRRVFFARVRVSPSYRAVSSLV